LGDQIEALGFTRHSQCKTENPTDPQEWQRLQRLLSWLEDVTGWLAHFPDFPDADVVRITLNRSSCKPLKGNFQRVIAERPFSYALIAGKESLAGLNYGYLPQSQMEKR
jgi:hypothetical protein